MGVLWPIPRARTRLQLQFKTRGWLVMLQCQKMTVTMSEVKSPGTSEPSQGFRTLF